MGLFTIQFELGEKTRETLAHIASTSVVRLELGPETRALIERLAGPDDGGARTVGGLMKKGADVLHTN